MKRYGCELEKINWIAPDGSHVSYSDSPELMDDEMYCLNRLSISKGTYIASGFNSFIVKLKNSPKEVR